MLSLWLNLQGTAGDLFSRVLAFLPGSQILHLVLFSTIVGILLVWFYSFVSFQKRLASLKKRIAALVYEPFLFSDSARISLLTPLRIAGLGAQYFLLSLPALIILACPAIWLLGLLNQSVGYDYVKPGEQILVTISAENAKNIRQLQVSLEGAGFEATSMVRSFPMAQAWVALRASPQKSATTLIIKASDSIIKIPLQGDYPNQAAWLAVITNSGWRRLLYPGSKLQLPGALSEISIAYPARQFLLMGVELSWMSLFILISMISGFAFAKKFKVQI